MKIKSAIDALNNFAPTALQEGFDNCGLIVGDKDDELKGILLCLDVTESVVREAIELGYNLIISHHPLIFRPLKRLTEQSAVERAVRLAIKNDVAIYAGHTNFDNAYKGVSWRAAEKLGLINLRTLAPKSDMLCKVICFVPKDYAEKLKFVAGEAGAGHIGNYDHCSFQCEGQGSFRALDGTNPFVGKQGEIHSEPECRLEWIVPSYLADTLVAQLREAHPYEEPAIDIYPLTNSSERIGLGVVGELPEEMPEREFLEHTKKVFGLPMLRHSELLGKNIRRVALCGGSGGDFVGSAMSSGADVYLTADLHYHHFYISADGLLVADIGHFESEKFVEEIFYEEITRKITNFAVRFSESAKNAVFYL